MNHGFALLDITKFTKIVQLLLGVCLEKESLGGVAKIFVQLKTSPEECAEEKFNIKKLGITFVFNIVSLFVIS